MTTEDKPRLNDEDKTLARKVGIHALCIASICDHFTRVSCGGSKLSVDSPVIGLLFGIQNGQDVSIFDGTEAIYDWNDGIVILNDIEINKKKSLWTAVFTSYELLGWYTVCENILPFHKEIHQSMRAFNESPLFVAMNPSPQADSKVLPLILFEMETHFVGDLPTSELTSIPFKLDTAQAERLAVDEVVKSSPQDGASSLEIQNQAALTSLRTLMDLIDEVVVAMKDMDEGRYPLDLELTRRIFKLYNQLPTLDPVNFKLNYDEHLTDCLMTTVLASTTKEFLTVQELSEAFSLAYGDRYYKSR